MISGLPSRRIIIIGGGVAGMSAAWRLARSGREVLVLEAKAAPGGRAGSAPDPKTGDPVDTGGHIFMGCYTAARSWFREMGTDNLIGVQDRLEAPYSGPKGERVVLRASRLPAPFHLLGALWKLPGMTISGMVKSLGLAAAAIRFKCFDTITVTDWADRLGLPSPVRDYIMYPLALAAINERPDLASALPFAQVIRRMAFGSGQWSGLAWPRTGLSGLYVEQVRAAVRAAGGDIRTRTSVKTILEQDGRAAGVRLKGGEEIGASAVVSAVPPWDLVPLVRHISACSILAERAAKFQPSPIMTVHLWLDRKIMADAVCGLPGGTFDWVMNLSGMTGSTGSGAQRVCLVRSGARELAGKKADELERLAMRDLKRFAPAGTSVIHRRVVWDSRATVSLVPGTDTARPGPVTPLPGLFLAGDWTQTRLPATVEGTVSSGMAAAQTLLQAKIA